MAPIKTREVQTKAFVSQKYNFGNFFSVRDVIEAVGQLKTEGLPIASNGSLYVALEKIYRSLGKSLDLDLKAGEEETERIENELLSITDNMEDAEKWVDLDPGQMKASGDGLGSKALNMQDLSKLLDEYVQGIQRNKNETSLREGLAEKYKIDRNQVEEWIFRLVEKEGMLKNKGFGQEVARDVAKKAVIREERLKKDLGRTGVKTDQINTVASQLVEGQAEAIVSVSNKDFKVASLKIEGLRMPKEVVAVAERQTRRLKNEIKVAQIVEEGQKAFVTNLRQGLKTSQPEIVFERHESNIARLTKEAMIKAWAGEYDNLKSAEVNVGNIDEPRLVKFEDALVNELKTDDGAVTIAVRSASQQVNNQQNNNIDVATTYEFVEKSEGIVDTIVGLNPNIRVEIVERYAEEVTRATLPIQLPGNRNVREISGKYGLNEDATASANLFFRVSSGMTDYKNLKDVSEKFEEAGGDSGIQIETGPKTRTSFRFLEGLRRNPLLDRGMVAIKKKIMGSLLANTTTVEGVTSFVTNNLGFSTIFGIETATAIPAVMGYFSAGGTIGGAIQGVMQAGGIANWVNGLITAGGMAAGATGEVAAAGGAAAVTTGATVAGGTAAAVSGPPGWVLAAIVAAGTLVVTVGKKVVGLLKKIGIDIGVLNVFSKLKIKAKERMGGLVGGVAGFVLDVGNLVVWGVGIAFAGAMAAAIKMITPVVVAVFIGIIAHQTLVTTHQGSYLIPSKESMGLGEDYQGGREYDPNGPPLIAEDLAGMECSLVSKTAGPVMQCRDPWRNLPLTSGCTMCGAGCGIAAVSTISMRVNSTLNPDYWTKNSIYSSASCAGTSIGQARSALLSFGVFNSGDIRNDGGCSPISIARSICDGNKLVIIVADFYKNSQATKVGGHFVTAVGVKNGEIVVMDPYYDEDGNGDGYTTPFLKAGEVAHYGAIYRVKSCLVINADKIN